MAAMSHDEFTRLFKFMQAESKRIDERFAAVDVRLDKIMAILDASTKRAEIHEQEFNALNHQVNRHEGWIHQIAMTTGDELAA